MPTPTNQIMQFGKGSGANVLTPTAYAALTTLLNNGFQAGEALSIQFNTVLRQSSFIATMIAQFICDKALVDVNDDGNLSTLETNFIAALNAVITPEIDALATALESWVNGQNFATQTWVNSRGFLTSVPVTSVAGKTGAVTLAVGDVSGAAPINNPTFTGSYQKGTTQSPGDNSTNLATTAYVDSALGSGYPKTIAAGDSAGNGSSGWTVNTSGMNSGGTGSVTSPSIDLSDHSKYLIQVAGVSTDGGGSAWTPHSVATGTSSGFNIPQVLICGGSASSTAQTKFTWSVQQLKA